MQPGIKKDIATISKWNKKVEKVIKTLSESKLKQKDESDTEKINEKFRYSYFFHLWILSVVILLLEH